MRGGKYEFGLQPVVHVMTVSAATRQMDFVGAFRNLFSGRLSHGFVCGAIWLAAFRLLTYRPAYLEAGCFSISQPSPKAL